MAKAMQASHGSRGAHLELVQTRRATGGEPARIVYLSGSGDCVPFGDRLVAQSCRLTVMTATLTIWADARPPMYVDEDVLTATKVLAAGRGDSESQVVEDALRAYLDAGRLEVARGCASYTYPETMLQLARR